MSVLTRQPQGFVRASPYWISRGLVFLFNGATFADAVTGKVATASGAVPRRATATGLAADISGTSYLEFPDSDALDITGELSIFWRGTLDAFGSYRCIVSKADTNGGTNTPFEVYIDQATNFLNLARANSNFAGRATPNAVPLGPVTLGILCPSVIEGSSSAFINGTKQATFSGTSLSTGAATGNTKTLRIGRRQDGATQLDGAVELIGIFNKRLSDEEYLFLYSRPNDLYATPRRVWVQLAPANEEVLDTYALTADNITGAQPVLGTPALTLAGDTYSLAASNLTGGTPSLQSATLTQNHGLTASNLAGTSATLQSPALTQNHVVTVSNLTGAAPALGSPALTLAGTFVADNLPGAQPVLGTPALTQQHSLTVTALTGAAATLGTPALTQNHVVTAANLTSAAPVLGAPTVVLGGTIVADNILGATPIFGTPALTQQHSLTATPLLGASAILGSPAFGQQHLLTGSGIVSSAPALGSPDLTSGSSGGTGATAEEVAAAVLAALNATAIPVNVQQVHGVPLAGVGSDGDPWRAA